MRKTHFILAYWAIIWSNVSFYPINIRTVRHERRYTAFNYFHCLYRCNNRHRFHRIPCNPESFRLHSGRPPPWQFRHGHVCGCIGYERLASHGIARGRFPFRSVGKLDCNRACHRCMVQLASGSRAAPCPYRILWQRTNTAGLPDQPVRRHK